MIIKEIEETLPDRGRGSDYAVHFVRLEDGNRAVWKPNTAKDDDPSKGLEIYVPMKEALAYQIDQIIGADLVPETVIHVHEGTYGVLQRFVEGAIVGQDAIRTDNPRFKFESMQRLGVFDFICSNPDRGPSNWMVQPDGSVVAIDNAGAFQNRDSFTWSTATIIGRPLEKGARELVGKAYERIKDICYAILDIKYKPREVVHLGLDAFDVAAELAVNHIHVLASAIGLTNDRYNMLGLIGCKAIGIDIAALKEEWHEKQKRS